MAKDHKKLAARAQTMTRAANRYGCRAIDIYHLVLPKIRQSDVNLNNIPRKVFRLARRMAAGGDPGRQRPKMFRSRHCRSAQYA